MPDEPLPHLFANGEILLDLTTPAMKVPLHQATDDMWGQQNPPQQQQAQVPAQQNGPQPFDPNRSVADENADFGSLSVFGVNVVDASDAFQQLMPRGPTSMAGKYPL